MKNISVQADKKISSGFKIFESDVRRLIQLSLEQILKSGTGNSYQHFILKFENGTVAKTLSIEDIFLEDNLGSNKIIMLEILTSNEDVTSNNIEDENVENSIIRITFNSINSDNNSESNAIRYKISGFSRDWVMVTTSLIEERLAKLQIRRFKIISKYVMALGMISMLFVLFSLLPSLDSSDTILNRLALVESAYKEGKFINTSELILAIEKAKIEKSSGVMTSKIMIIPILLLSLTLFSELKILSLNKLYPLYNFCWGDYLEEFKKIEKRRRFIVGLVIVTIVLGIAINLLSNVIWNKIVPQ